MSENKRGRTFRSRGYPNGRGHRVTRSHYGGHSGTASGYSSDHNSCAYQEVEQAKQTHSHCCRLNESVINPERQLLDQRLLSAVKDGTIEDVKKLLKPKKIAGNYSQDILDTAIFVATQRGHKCIVQALVGAGASVASRNADRYTPLMLASEKGYMEIMKFLIKKGANVNVRNTAGDSPLLLCILPSGSADMVQLLVDYKANVNFQNREGNSAVMKATETRDLDAIRVLIDAGAKLHLKNTLGETIFEIARRNELSMIITIFRDHKTLRSKATPLMKAVTKCHLNAVKLLLDCHNSEVNTAGENGRTPLLALLESMTKSKANWLNKINILKLLLQNGANIDGKPNSSMTLDSVDSPLVLMTSSGCCEVVKLLCEHKANMNIVSLHGLTPLMIAAKDGRADLLVLLLDNGADIHMKNSKGENALFTALIYGNMNCVKILFDISSKLPFTAREVTLKLISCDQVASLEFLVRKLRLDVNEYLLHKTVKKGNMDMVRLMIDLGADLHKPDSCDYTVLFHTDKTEIAELLVEHGADINVKHPIQGSLLIAAAAKGNLSLVRFFLDSGIDVDGVDSSKMTALIHAVLANCASIFQMLLERGADINKQTENCETALMFAVERQKLNMVSMLIDAGADMEIKTLSGETAFLSAAGIGDLDILRVLKQRGANVIASDCDGCTALMKAVMNSRRYQNFDEVITLLVYDQQYLNRQNNEGFTALMLASEQAHFGNVKILLQLGADGNIVAKNSTALSHLLANTFFQKTELECISELVKCGALSSLPAQYGSALHKMILADQRSLVELLITHGMGPMVMDREPTLLRSSCMLPCKMSPLHTALLCGNNKIARYLSDIWFLTTSDVFGLPKDEDLRRKLANYTKCIEVLDEHTAQPPSLLKMSFVVVSTCLGSNPGREERVRKTPLPALMQQKLLFQSHDCTIDMSVDDEGEGNMRDPFDSEYDQSFDSDHSEYGWHYEWNGSDSDLDYIFEGGFYDYY